MAILWKWPSSQGVWHMENPLDSSGKGNDLVIVGAINGPGKLNNAYDLDGLNDYINADSAIPALANSTKGTIVSWQKSIFNGSAQNLFSLSISGGAISTGINILVDWGNNRVRVFAHKDNVLVWDYHTPTGSMTAFNGIYTPITVSHDGTKISEITIAGTPQAIIPDITVDEAVWFKACITDAFDKSDAASWGITRAIGSLFNPFKGGIDESGIFTEVWDSVDVAAFWNGGAGQDMSEPPPPPLPGGDPTPLFERMFDHLNPKSEAFKR